MQANLAPPADPAAQTDAAPSAGIEIAPTAAAIRIEPVAAAAEPTILLRTDAAVGLAAFRIASDMLIVLDAPIAFQPPGNDLDPVFANISSRRTLDATVIRIPAMQGLRLARVARGWVVTAATPPEAITSILPRRVNGAPDTSGLRFPVAEPSRVVVVVNPQTGDRLLVGTQGVAGQAVPNEWTQDQFTLLRTLQGVVVSAISDDIRLRRDAAGFALSTNLQTDTAMAGIQPNQSDPPVAGAISRLFDIPNGSTKALSEELKKRILAAGNAHALARSKPRLRVAETMLALGMDAEAQAAIDVAATTDPTLLDQPRAIGLRAVAATLAGRLDDAAALADPRLTGSTETELWRAILQLAREEVTPADARSLASGLGLVLAYPDPLRDRLLPRVLEAMASNGQAEAAQATLKTLPSDRRLDLARAMTAEAVDKSADALKLYDQVASGSDRLARYMALVRAAELRMKTGAIDLRSGADALDKALLGWRTPRRELALRLRIADLRRQAGQWREALTVLREGRAAYPSERPRFDQKVTAIFTALLTDDAARRISPSDFVVLYDQNLDLIRELTWTEQSGSELVDRLISLDLPGRGEPILAKLVANATDPVRRAVLGARLASLRITTGDPAGAIDGLATTVPPGNAAVDPALMQARQFLYAHAESERGNKDAALAMLGKLESPEADDLRARIFASRKDWGRAVNALTALEHKRIAGSDLNPAQQAIVMRLAVAATLGGDSTTLVRVSDTYGPAMAKGTSASLFRLMTSGPLRDTADLPRVMEEIQSVKQLENRARIAGRP